MKRIGFVAAVVACAMAATLGMAERVEAAPVTVTVTGRATEVGPTLDLLGFAVSDQLTLTYTFDDLNVFDSAPASDVGHFLMPTGSMTVQLSGYTASVLDIGFAVDAASDVFSFGNNGSPMASDLPPGFQVQGLSFFVQDTTLSSIASDAFMAGPTFKWDNSGFTFFVDQPLRTYVVGVITGVKVDGGSTEVPEPVTLSLLGAGIAGVLLRRRRTR